MTPEADRPILIVGGSGFLGRHLIEVCLKAGLRTVATSRNWTSGQLGGDARLTRVPLDICDGRAVRETVHRWRPRFLVMLAGLSSVAQAAEDSRQALEVNVLGTWNVFAAARDAVHLEKLVWVGSGEAYGASAVDVEQVLETAPLQPITLYGLTKATGDWLAALVAHGERVPIVRARLFPCTGPGQSARFVCADFARQVASAEREGRRAQILGGNLEVIRDFTDVRDAAEALLGLALRGEAGEAYNVCSGRGRTIREVAESLLRVAGSEGSVASRADKQRRIDIPRLVGSPQKLAAATGWLPRRVWEQTLRDLLDDWRQRSRSTSSVGR